jgi:hypothetical protein
MLEGVEFRTSRYTPEIARILEQEGGGQRLMPLVRTGASVSEAREAVKRLAIPEAASRRRISPPLAQRSDEEG